MKKGIKKHNNFFIIAITIVFGISFPIFNSASRFVNTSISEHYYNAKEFYFNSEVLNGSTYHLYNWDGTNNYQIVVDTSNSKDLLNWTKSDIAYTITTDCASDVGEVSCSSSGTTSLVTNLAMITTGSNTITLNIGDNTFSKGDTVNIEITATSSVPYEKSLTATFVVEVNKAEINYFIEDQANRNYFNLVLTNNATNRNILLTIDDTLVNIDGSNYFVKNGVKTYDAVTGVIDSLSFATVTGNTYSIRFYKNNPSVNYSLSNNIVTIS